MKKILCTAFALACLGNASAHDALSGFYLGGGVNVNHDVGSRDGWAEYNVSAPLGGAIGKQTDLSCGIHALLGYGHLFTNRVFVGIEQQIGIAYHPSQTENYITNEKVKFRTFKRSEFTTLARLGYGFESFPGTAYVSAGAKVLKIADSGHRKICIPVFGVGYQHELSQHWSIRGDVLHTPVDKITFVEKVNDTQFNQKGKGHRMSAMVTIVYAF